MTGDVSQTAAVAAGSSGQSTDSSSKRKVSAALLSVVSNCLLVALKAIIGYVTGSVGILSEAIHSCLDLVAALIAFFTVRESAKPADELHPFGHGKFENLSGLLEGLLILLGALWIFWEALDGLNHPKLHHEHMLWGIGIMGISGLANLVISTYLMRVAKAEDSLALAADAMHLRADVVTSFGVLVGLALALMLQRPWIDPAVALLVGVLILRAAVTVIRPSLAGLLDMTVEADDEQRIRAIIDSHAEKYVEYHDLRSRKSGPQYHVDLHMVFDGNLSLEATHQVCDIIEAAIQAEFPQAMILVHPEPLSQRKGNLGQ